MFSKIQLLSIGICCLILSACSSQEQIKPVDLSQDDFASVKIVDVGQDDFASIKIELQNKGVWTDIPADALEDDVATRTIFQKNVENYYSDSSNQFLSKGLLFEAINELDKGLDLAPWSSLLIKQNQSIMATYDVIIGFKTNWMHRKKAIQSITRVAEDYLITYKQHYPNTNEYPSLHGLYELATETYIQQAASTLKNKSPTEVFEAYEYTIELINYSGQEIDIPCLSSLAKLEEYTSFKDFDDSLSILAATKKCNDGQNVSHPGLAEFEKLIEITLFNAATKIVDDIAKQPASIHLINEIELKLPKTPISNWARERIIASLVNFHIEQANKLSSLGSPAYLALFHTDRARSLNKDYSKQSLLIQTKGKVLNSIDKSEKLASGFVVDLASNIDPVLNELVKSALSLSVSNKSHDLINWYFSEKEETDSKRRIELTRVKYHSPFDELKAVESSYYLETIEVENPRKIELEARVESAEQTMIAAKRFHDTAVRLNEDHPTDGKYKKVTDANKRYVIVENVYNSLVEEYEATPPLITLMVYEPYTYHEGNIKHGWEITAKVTEGKKTYVISGQDIKSSFMRVGTHQYDVNKRHRVDQVPDFSMDLNDIVSSLFSTIDEVTDQLPTFVSNNPDIPSIDELDELELVYLNALLHPWGLDYVDHSAFPQWLSDTIRKQSISAPDHVPELQLFSSIPKPITSTEGGSLAFQDSIVKVSSTGVKGTGYSSGVIIRPDGLLLTTAHGIGSNLQEVEVLSGNNKGIYNSNVVYIDQKNDVAILAIEGGSEFDWMPVELRNTPAVGEKVLIFGKTPKSDKGITTPLGTVGTISPSQDVSWGSSRIVANLPRAFETSGGAVVSMESGKLIGLVAAFTPPTYNQEGSDPGVQALLIPSKKFGKWLGLEN